MLKDEKIVLFFVFYRKFITFAIGFGEKSRTTMHQLIISHLTEKTSEICLE